MACRKKIIRFGFTVTLALFVIFSALKVQYNVDLSEEGIPTRLSSMIPKYFVAKRLTMLSW